MKTTVKSFFLLLFASATLASCDSCGDVSITEPSVEDTKWLVYNSTDTAIFKVTFNGTEERATYLRTGIYAQNVPGDGFSITDECIDQRNTQLTNIIEDKDKKLPFMGTYILKKPDSLIVRVGVGNKAAWEIKESTPTQEVTVGGTPYPNSYVFTGTGTATEDPKTVYFRKDKGFLMVELNNGKKLELVELKTKTN